MGLDMDQERCSARVAELAIWFGHVDPLPLAGGITNQNFTVEDRGRRYVVRVGSDILVHGVVRANELAASRAAHLAGLSPCVVHAEPGIVVLDFIEGRTLHGGGRAQPRQPRAPGRHSAALPPRHSAIFARACRDVLGVPCRARLCPHAQRRREPPHSSPPGSSRRAERLGAAVGPIDIVFGHNDLLAANFIDDGERLWLVDWEYAGFNSPLFDLGGLASNSELSPEQAERLLEPLFRRAGRRSSCAGGAAAMTAASLLRETMWSMVSEIHSTIDFDYAAYTAENLRRFEAAYAAFGEMDPHERAAVFREDRRRRRRHRRLFGRLSSRQDGAHRRAAARAGAS